MVTGVVVVVVVVVVLKKSRVRWSHKGAGALGRSEINKGNQNSSGKYCAFPPKTHDTHEESAQVKRNLPRLCSVGFVQTIHGVNTPGITLQRTSIISSVGHSYPYPELLEVLCDVHTYTRNFWKFCTPVATIPGVRVQYVLYPLITFVSSVRLCHSTRNFWKFCKTSVPVSGTSGSSVRSSYPYPEVM